MKTLSKFKTLVLLQLKDKLDSSFIQKTNILRLVIFTLLKFVIVAGVTYVFLFFCRFIGIFYYSESTIIMTLVLTVSFILSLISSTYELMHNLYLQEDNKVLITLPVNSSMVFTSKLVVFYIYEIKKNLGFLIPITFGSLLLLVNNHCASFVTLIWMWVPMIFITALPVLLGALLSIPTMYVYNFLRKHLSLQLIVTFVAVILVTLGVVKLINLIPDSINLINQWPKVRTAIGDFLRSMEKNLFVFKNFIRVITGEQATSSDPCKIQGLTFLKLGIIILMNIVLVVLVYFISRPIYFRMVTKSLENKQNRGRLHSNSTKNKYFTFVDKEFKLNLRTASISVNYLIVYIVVPILILLLNALYQVMEVKYLGLILKYVFNILMITLPMLASNSIVATYYSSEGRTGYMKKVKPVYAIIPLVSKMVFNFLFSIPSIFISVAIFGRSVSFNFGISLLMGLMITFVHFGHMIWSATQDIVNPQNEQYATLGVNFNNPNEGKSTVAAFVVSIVFSLISFKILYETCMDGTSVYGVLKLLGLSIVFFAGCLLLFIKKVKAFYYD